MERHSDELLITAEALSVYAELTDDYNPIHMDPAFAAGTVMKGVIAHGTLSLALIWQALARQTEAPQTGLLLDIRFIKPVRLGDWVHAGARPGLPGEYEVWVANDRDEVVIAGTATFPCN